MTSKRFDPPLRKTCEACFGVFETAYAETRFCSSTCSGTFSIKRHLQQDDDDDTPCVQRPLETAYSAVCRMCGRTMAEYHLTVNQRVIGLPRCAVCGSTCALEAAA